MPAKVSSCFPLIFFVKPNSLAFKIALNKSKIYSQLVFDVRIFDLFTDYINHYMYLIKHLFSYSWLKFYMEESIKKSYLKQSDDIVFTIDMASKLPFFPVDSQSPYTNPYLPLMISYSELNPSMNISGVKITQLSDIKRIATLSEFKKRLNIFICRKSEINLFNGIDFEKNKMAISGSIMSACLQYKHPLMKLFLTTNNSSMDDLFSRFFNEYYCESDIDIMIHINSAFFTLNQLGLINSSQTIALSNPLAFSPVIKSNDSG